MKKRIHRGRVHLLPSLLVGSLGVLLLFIIVTLFFEGAIYRSRYQTIQQGLQRLAGQGSDSYKMLQEEGIPEKECQQKSLALMASASEYGDYLTLLDREGNVTAQTPDPLYPVAALDPAYLHGEPGYQILSQGGTSFFLGTASFGGQDGRLILYCPASILVQDYAAIRNGMVGLSALTFAVAFLVAFLLSLQPVKNLEKDNRQLSASSWNIGRKYAQQCLYELATGQRTDVHDLQTILAGYTAFDLNAPMGLALVLPDQYRRFADLLQEDRVLYLFGICNILEDLTKPFAVIQGCTEQEEARCLLLYQLQGTADLQRFQQKLREGQKAISKVYDLSVTILLTAPSRSVFQLPDCYEALLRHRYDRLLAGPQTLILVENCAEPEDPSLPDWQKTYQEKLQNLLHDLQNGQLESADPFVLLLGAQKQDGWRYRTALALMIGGLEQCVRLLIATRKLESDFDFQFHEEDFDTADQIETWLQDHVQKIQKAVRSAADRRTQLYVQMADRLVEQHYSDSSYGVQQIAEEVGLSGVYLSKVYRQQTGGSLLDRLTECRLRHAVKMLTESEAPVAEIATQCGYSSVNYFHHIFKKATGITPRQYRGLPPEQRAQIFPGKEDAP